MASDDVPPQEWLPSRRSVTATCAPVAARSRAPRAAAPPRWRRRRRAAMERPAAPTKRRAPAARRRAPLRWCSRGSAVVACRDLSCRSVTRRPPRCDVGSALGVARLLLLRKHAGLMARCSWSSVPWPIRFGVRWFAGLGCASAQPTSLVVFEHPSGLARPRYFRWPRAQRQ